MKGKAKDPRRIALKIFRSWHADEVLSKKEVNEYAKRLLKCLDEAGLTIIHTPKPDDFQCIPFTKADLKSVSSAPEENQNLFTNYYRCPDCAKSWHDNWSCMCNDKCPECNAEIEPYKSKDNTDGSVVNWVDDQ